MFGLFYQNEFKGFWSNKKGDVFLANTMMNLGMNPEEVELFFYTGIADAPSLYNFDESHGLKILEQVTTSEEIEGEMVETTALNTLQEIEAETIYLNGVFHQIC